MKKIHLSRLLASVGCATILAAPALQAANYPTEVLSDGPLAYYRLNENATPPPPDIGTNRGSLGVTGDGSYFGAFSRPVPGAIAGNGAIAFTNPGLAAGTYNAALTVAHHTSLNPSGAFTVEFWAKPSNDSAQLLSPVNSMSFIQGRAGYLFYQNANTWQFRIGYTGSTAASLINGGIIVPNTWQHVVGTYSGGVSGTMTLFVNGVQVATGAVATYEPNTDSPFRIGATSAPNREFDGAVDEVAFYGSVLSPTTIAAHYAAATSNPAGYAGVILADAPVGYWRLDEPAIVWTNPVAPNSGTLGAVADGAYIGGAVNTTGPSAPTYPGFEANNKSGGFNGTSAYVGTTNSLLNNRAAYTVMGWLKRGVVHSTRGGYFGQNNLLEFGDAGGGAQVEAWIDAIGGNLLQPWPWADDAWGFICLTGDGQMNRLFMDGRVVASAASGVSSYGANTFKFNIGGGGIFNDTGDFFNGNIDEVAMFDKALKPGRILTLYAIATGSPLAPEIFSDPVLASPTNNVFATTTFTLSVDVGGAQPMTYQWYKDGNPVSGATQATYTKVNCTTSDSGNYTVKVVNTYGNAETYSPLTMTIDPASPPTIVRQPVSRTGYVGGDFSFDVVLTGTTPFTYQWKRGGVNLPGETNARLSVPASAGTAGNYSVGITNVAGGVVSAVATATLRTPTPGSYEAAVVAASPTSYWRLDGTDAAIGTVIVDSFGRNDGTLDGYPTVNQPGAIVGDTDTCIIFDGSSSKVEVPYSASLNGTTFSVECWARRDFKAGAYASPVTSRDSSANIQHGYIFYDAASGSWENWSGQTGGGWQTLTGPTVVQSEWAHLVMTYDSATSTKSFYVNGALVGTATTSFAPNRARPFRIGAGSTEMAGDWWYGGGVDEVAYYPSVLSANTVAAHYGLARFGTTTPPTITQQPVGGTNYAGATRTLTAAAQGSPTLNYQWQHAGTNLPGATLASLKLVNLQAADAGTYRVVVNNANGSATSDPATVTVIALPTTGYASVVMVDRPSAYYPLDDAIGSATAYEAYNFGLYDGTYNGGLPDQPGATTFTGKSVQFFGTDWIGMGNPDGLNFTGPISVEAWFKPDAYPSDFGNIVAHGYGGTDDRELILRLNTSQNVLWDGYSGSTGGNGVATAATFPLGQWVHAVGTFGANGYRLYINGVLAVSNSNTVRPAPIGFDWAIGGRAGGGRNFTGNIDEVAIYDYALTGLQVASHYYYAKNGVKLDPRIVIGISGGNITLTWPAGTLQQADQLTGPWTNVPGATSPLTTPASGAQKFYRLTF